jgi:hypothetical protein
MYYPLSEITSNLYTNGFEFVDLITGELYVGDYFSTTDGKYFTGKLPSNDSRELLKAQNTTSSLYVSSPESFFPSPTKEDYEKGFITRYVIKRVNSGIDTILEVSKEDYEKSKSNPIYNQVEFNWKITGNLLDDFSNEMYPVYGIISTNRSTLEKISPKLPGIEEVFVNLSEFSQ